MVKSNNKTITQSDNILKIVMTIFILCCILAGIGMDNDFELMVEVGIVGIIICALCMICPPLIVPFIRDITSSYPFTFKFQSQEVRIWGYMQKVGNDAFEVRKVTLSYSEFSIIKLDIEKILFIMTGSNRMVCRIMLKNAKKAQIEQILKEFSKRGKQVQTAPELYGLYSVKEEN